MLTLLLLSLSLIPLSLSKPLELPKDPELSEGDLLLTPDQKAKLFGSSRDKRQAVTDSQWLNGRVLFEYHSDLGDQMKFQVRKAMELIASKTCVTFVESEKETPRIVIYDSEGSCYASLGMFDFTYRNLALSSGCPTVGNAFHELSHSLGLLHTMSRYDRDDYLYVNSTDMRNFPKYTKDESYNVIPYEYGSSMQYRASSESWPKDLRYVRTMGSRLVSFYDVAAINRHYHCSCDKELECKNGGNTNPANCSECNCPAGFGGVLCNKAPGGFTKILQAEPQWKDHSFKFGFLGLYEIREFTRATLFITAPRDTRIQVQPTKMLNFYCDTYCVFNGFEVKYMGDPRVTNPLFCCEADHDWNATFTSKLNPMPINFFTRYERIEMEFRYRWINGSVDDLPKTTNGFDDYQYPK